MESSSFKNALYNAVGYIFPVVIALFTTPYIVHKLTPEIYGIYVLAISLMGLMSFMDLGFGQGIIKFVSHYEAQKNYEKINKIIGVSLFINGVMGIIGAILIFLFAPLLVKLFNVKPEQYSLSVLSFRIVSLGFFVMLLNGVFSNIPRALQRYDISVKIQNGIWFCSVIGTIVILYFDKGLFEILLSYIIFQLIGAILFANYSRKLLPLIRYRIYSDIDVLKEVFSFNIFIALNMVSGNIVMKIDKMLISYYLGPTSTALYTVPYNLASMISSFVGSINQFIFPKIAGMNSQGKNDELKNNFIRYLDFTGFVSSILMILFILYSDNFILIWMGRDFAAKSVKIAPMLGYTFFYSCITSVTLWYFTALAKTHINLISSLSGSLLYIVLSTILIPSFHLMGATLAFMGILVPFPFYNYYICKVMNVPFTLFVRTIALYSFMVTITLIFTFLFDHMNYIIKSIYAIVILYTICKFKATLAHELLSKLKTVL